MRAAILTALVLLALAAGYAFDRMADERAGRLSAEQAVHEMAQSMQRREREYQATQQALSNNRAQLGEIERNAREAIDALRNDTRAAADDCADRPLPAAISQRLQQLTAPR